MRWAVVVIASICWPLAGCQRALSLDKDQGPMPNGVYPLFRFVDAKRDSAWTLSFSSPSLPVHLRFPLFYLLPSFFISFISHEVRRWPKTDCPSRPFLTPSPQSASESIFRSLSTSRRRSLRFVLQHYWSFTSPAYHFNSRLTEIIKK